MTQRSASSPTIISGNGDAPQAQASSAGRPRGSTGPRTTLGKERSKRNALKHGLFSQVAVLKDESPSEYRALLDSLRQALQPDGALEEMLVEKLGILAWRLRRLITAETAEIQRSIELITWREHDQQAGVATDISKNDMHYDETLISEISNADVLEVCLALLEKLREQIQEHGFDAELDSPILTRLYGEASGDKWPGTLFDSYSRWSETARCSENERQQRGYATPEKCQSNFLEGLDGEIKRLERYKKTRPSVEKDRKKLEVLRQHVPLTPEFDHFQRYEASLERNFDRALAQLERLQRMRFGQPTLPRLEVQHSLS